MHTFDDLKRQGLDVESSETHFQIENVGINGIIREIMMNSTFHAHWGELWPSYIGAK